MFLRTKLPSYEKIVLEPGQSVNLNTTVANQIPVFINVHDAVTNDHTPINGKSVYLVFPKLYLVPYTPVGKFWAKYI